MISRRTSRLSILQSCSVLTRSSSPMNVSLLLKQWVRFPSSSRAFLSALPYKQTSCRSLIWVPLSERCFNYKINGACHRNAPDRYQRHDRRLLVMVARANILKSKSCIRCSLFRETSQKSSVTSEASSDESSNVVVSEPPAARQTDEGSNPQILKNPEPSSNSSSVVLQHWLEQLKSPPNMITASRILIIPFISYWIITHQTQPAIVGCIYAAVSDVLDGLLARRYPHMQTALGTYLDPLADKFFINALSISLWIQGTIPGVLMGLWLMRDVLLMVATHQYVAQNTAPGLAVMDPVTVPLKVTPTTISKVNTALQFVTLTVGIVCIVPPEVSAIDIVPMFPPWNDWIVVRLYMSENVLPALCWITGTTTILSFFSYWGHSAFAAVVSSKTLPHTTK